MDHIIKMTYSGTAIKRAIFERDREIGNPTISLYICHDVAWASVRLKSPATCTVAVTSHERQCVSNHWQLNCLFNRRSRLPIMKTSQICKYYYCPFTDWRIPSKRDNNTETFSCDDVIMMTSQNSPVKIPATAWPRHSSSEVQYDGILGIYLNMERKPNPNTRYTHMSDDQV